MEIHIKHRSTTTDRLDISIYLPHNTNYARYGLCLGPLMVFACIEPYIFRTQT